MAQTDQKPETWWVAERRTWQTVQPKPVEVFRHTQASVWIAGRYYDNSLTGDLDRCARISESSNYFPTWEEARDFMLRCARSEYKSALKMLESARQRLIVIEAWEESEATSAANEPTMD